MSEKTSTFCDYCNPEMLPCQGYLIWSNHERACNKFGWRIMDNDKIMCTDCQEEKGLLDK